MLSPRRKSLLNLDNTRVKHCFDVFRVSLLVGFIFSCLVKTKQARTMLPIGHWNIRNFENTFNCCQRSQARERWRVVQMAWCSLLILWNLFSCNCSYNWFGVLGGLFAGWFWFGFVLGFFFVIVYLALEAKWEHKTKQNWYKKNPKPKTKACWAIKPNNQAFNLYKMALPRELSRQDCQIRASLPFQPLFSAQSTPFYISRLWFIYRSKKALFHWKSLHRRSGTNALIISIL